MAYCWPARTIAGGSKVAVTNAEVRESVPTFDSGTVALASAIPVG
jgi:hypothetical protein